MALLGWKLTTLQKQAFENTFFNLLRLHTDNLEAVEQSSIETHPGGVETETKITRGKSAFKILYEDFKLILGGYSGGIHHTTYDRHYQDMYDQHQMGLEQYFTTIQSIIKFITDNDIDDKNFYVNLYKAHFSKYELLLFLYYETSIHANPSFNKLLVDFQFFNSLPTKDLINEDDVKDLDGNFP
ncbi:MAG: putative phage abortive infection protein [Desulfobulbaceae bacterium]|nr:putative phage abortive infection protein [Desulfobulbaceae bacterium]